ncbi:uncharacterized protein YndB with AHSA1/START domain [Panacagrimonas perspica]|uniref:Uncharacterized protein YndB with AHSA1/START domain n=1 Tax=Panacagrimonas perspica TaxID=381431 RepID=A0A4R7NYY6_9GAMM|nr:SRPBCC domain-containing protein [Panacagrimonas perspica]TDU25760.1 uncharacterized protein YndB with AHSA1/START domain [Panacagrimonas perspica]
MNMPDHEQPAVVHVRREIAASADEVFDAWLDPESLADWMRPGQILRTSAKVDARVGGRYEVLMHRQDDSLLHTGTYRVIDRPRRLQFTWISPATEQRETLVTVEFLARGDERTEVRLTHEQLPQTEETLASHTQGWTMAFERLHGRCTAARSR